MIQKQTNHLINEIKSSKNLENKIIGCSAIILTGLSYKIDKNYLNLGLNFLKKITKYSTDNQGFSKSRNIKEQIFYLKYFILIREWFKEAQVEIPEYLDETIYNLGQAYAFFWQNTGADLLFNGNNNSNNQEFDNYLKRLGYKFKNENKDYCGYTILRNKKICIAMDTGSSPESKYSEDYQSGALSFEIFSNGKITKKKYTFEKNYWNITAAHDGYLKKYNSIHERNLEFYPEQMKIVGIDRIIKKKTNNNYKFEIRFHLEPDIKLMQTQDNKSILIELNEEGWKFTCDNYDISIDNGLYFGNKNSYTENQNIFISGISNNNEENIKWEIKKL